MVENSGHKRKRGGGPKPLAGLLKRRKGTMLKKKKTV